MPDSQVLKKSVTLNDYADDPRQGVLNVWVGSPVQPGLSLALPPDPPPYWTETRDDVLRGTIYFESLWAAAIFIAVSKASSLTWNLKGFPSLRVRKAMELLQGVQDGKGRVEFVSRHLRDYLLTDNGAFIEIVRASSAAGSRILGLVHLDSRRCRRTGDPDVPIIYRDRKGYEHEIQEHQVICMADMPDAGDTFYGVGFCSASRAYHAIYKLAGLEKYVSEKVTGRRPLAIHVVNNITRTQLEQAVLAHETTKIDQGFRQYMAAVIIPGVDPNSPATVATIDLAGLPDGFEPQQERRYAILTYADALGLDPQELDPDLLASKGMGTGSQSKVLDDKASGRGIISWREQFTHHLNWNIIPNQVQFYFGERDLRDRKLKLDVESLEVANAVQMTVNNILKPLEARQVLVDRHVLPPEFIPADMTALTDLDDNERLDPEGLYGQSPLTQMTVDQLLQSQQIESEQQQMGLEQQQLGLEGQEAANAQQAEGGSAPPGNLPKKEPKEKE